MECYITVMGWYITVVYYASPSLRSRQPEISDLTSKPAITRAITPVLNNENDGKRKWLGWLRYKIPIYS